MSEDLIFKGIFTTLVVILGVGLSFWVILSDRRSSINRALFVLINLIVLYILSDYLAGLLVEPFTTILMRLAYSFGIVAVGTFYYFSLKFPFIKKNNIFIDTLLLFSVVATFIFTFSTNLVIHSTQFVDWGVMVKEGNMILAYYSLLAFLLLLGFMNIIMKYRLSTKKEKSKIRYLLIGMAVFAVAQIIFTIISPTIGIGQYYFFGDYSMVIFCGLAAYAIVKRRLFDVKLAIVRSVTYSLVLIALALVYLIVAYVLSAIFNNELTTPEQTISGVIISLMLAFAFQPIKRFFNKITNRIFYKDYYNSDDFFARLNSTLSITTELRSLLERVAYEIGHTLKSDQAFFFINTFDGHYVSAGTAHHKQLPKSDAARLESAYDSKNSVIIASSLKTHDPIRRLMLSHRIELLLPLVQAGEFIGHLCLGDHLNSGYTNRDLKVLDTISDELAIAIQNSLAVQEIRELNSTLQQRINNATKELRASNSMLRQLDEAKDEFVSMASHQLRTPLTSVKGYISMLIEGDAGKITDAQRHFLDEAFMSSERMVRLINDFLNVSRIQTGKFIIDKRPTDLSKVVEQEIESLRPSAISRNLEYIYKSPKDFPTVNIDEGKIRQVVMNFCDNALYYSHENTKIFVNLSIDKGEILFTVKDHGIGVPSRERTHLFSKFFRATNARKQRPDGTGVGLYLTKKIINAHDGKIVFESVEGQGSTFGFRLPLDN